MGVRLRDLKARDRASLEEMLARISSFDAQDRSLAMELIDIALNQADQKDYRFILAVDEQDRLVGYVCFGPIPLTDRAYDLYWIVVDPRWAHQGIGTLLLKTVEEGIQSKRGRMLLIDTSSGEAYEQSRRFYLKNGYTLAETVRDLYREGEDRLTYIKRF